MSLQPFPSRAAGQLGEQQGLQRSLPQPLGSPCLPDRPPHARTGIADAVLLRTKPKAADQVELYPVQLKGGASRFKAHEMTRLEKAAAAVKAVPLIILHDGERLHFLGGEPAFTTRGR